jgi:AcrR family transcriptional regulator
MGAETETTDLPRRRSDGAATHAAILDAAMRLASIEGLGSLTIGRLARELGISKSGVFAHFSSKVALQRETIDAARDVFEREVVRPALAAPEGLGHVEAFCEAYLSYVERGVFPGGCFFAHALAEFDAQDGPIHAEVVADQRAWSQVIGRQIEIAKRSGEIAPDVDGEQLAFELLAALELANYLSTLARDPSIVERGRRSVRATLERARKNAGTGGVVHVLER